jgi:hypothetical protein
VLLRRARIKPPLTNKKREESGMEITGQQMLLTYLEVFKQMPFPKLVPIANNRVNGAKGRRMLEGGSSDRRAYLQKD